MGGNASRTDLLPGPAGWAGGPLSGGGGGPGPLLPKPALGPMGLGDPPGKAGRGAGALMPGGFKAAPRN